MSPVAALPAVTGDTIVVNGAASHVIHQVTVQAKRRPMQFATDSTGNILLGTGLLERMPKLMGNSDPLHAIQSLPGVHTNSEYDSGIHIDGCETSHLAISLSGVPVYGAAHLLGLFSVFNPSHFSTVRMRRNTCHATSATRLGAELDMCPSTAVPDSTVEGNLAMGLMSSQGTLRVRTSSTSALTVSARRSYLNLLYSPLLKMDENDMRYGFGDYNATFVWHPSRHDVIQADFYGGNDAVQLTNTSYQALIGLTWHNLLGSLSWSRNRGGRHWHSCLYATQYASRLNVTEEVLGATLRSSIAELGCRSRLDIKRFNIGFNISCYSVQPQTQDIANQDIQPAPASSSVLCTLYGGYTHSLGKVANLAYGIKGHCFTGKAQTCLSADPTLTLTVSTPGFGQLEIGGGLQSQYLSQTGFSARGLPTEFWITPCETGVGPQTALGASILWKRTLPWSGWTVEAGAFYKRLMHQVEYKGDILSLLAQYHLTDNLLYGDGHNYGCTAMLGKHTGRLTGWVAYSWLRARRHFNQPGYSGSYPAQHERPHEFNAVAMYRVWRFDVSASFVYASGTPFTPVTDMYLMAGNYVTQYARHNSGRLNPYIRLDASVTFRLKTRGRYRHSINASVYNATARGNDLFCRIKYDDEGRVAYRPLSFFVNALPSFSYHLSF